MQALLYVFKFQLILAIFMVIIPVGFLLLPGKYKNKNKKVWALTSFFIVLTVLLISIHTRKKPLEVDRNYPIIELDTSLYLAQASRPDFYIGVAVSEANYSHKLIPLAFSSITPDNATKWGRLIKGNDLGTYDFSIADSIVNYAIENDLRVRGHVLTWGRAADFFKRPDLNTLLNDVSKEQMRDTLNALIKGNIEEVLGHFQGRIRTWDCVNEPLEVFNGKPDNNIFYRHTGLEYIKNSFIWAHEADPTVTLYLNEQFDDYKGAKADAFLELLAELLREDIPVHGVGIQAHAMFKLPDLEAFRVFLERISEMGLEIEITEFDARLRLFSKETDPYEAQGRYYRDFSEICLENPSCKGITFWGISDANSYYDHLGIFKLHLPNNPLLFDNKMNPKPAYFGVLQALQSHTGTS